MKSFHPRRIIRSIPCRFETSLFRLRCRVRHVRCEIGENTRIRHCRVKSKEDGTLTIGANCTLHGVEFCFYGNGGRIELKDRSYFNAYPRKWISLFVKDRSTIRIEEDCLFSNSIDITTTDWHSVYDDSGNLMNPEKDVKIGKHVWIGRKVTICKGVSVPNDSVIGVGSVVTRSFYESNVIIAGNPADIKKRGINWKV